MDAQKAERALRAFVDIGCPSNEEAPGGITKYARCYWCNANLFDPNGPGGYGDPGPYTPRSLTDHDADCSWRLAVEALEE